MTVSMVSTNRLPVGLWVPKLSFPPDDRVKQGAFGLVVGRLDACDLDKRPEVFAITPGSRSGCRFP